MTYSFDFFKCTKEELVELKEYLAPHVAGKIACIF